jgi:ketosteroid isomerase-like protein
MTEKSISTRRAFLKGSAIIAAPLAAIGAPAAAALADDSKARLARLEDEKAIRALHGSWLRLVNAGNYSGAAQLYTDDKCSCALAGIASVAPDHGGAEDSLAFARDGQRASASYATQIEVETMIAPDNTLAQMLHAQGEGTIRTREARTLRADYVRTRGGGWAIAKLDFQTA